MGISGIRSVKKSLYQSVLELFRAKKGNPALTDTKTKLPFQVPGEYADRIWTRCSRLDLPQFIEQEQCVYAITSKDIFIGTFAAPPEMHGDPISHRARWMAFWTSDKPDLQTSGKHDMRCWCGAVKLAQNP